MMEYFYFALFIFGTLVFFYGIHKTLIIKNSQKEWQNGFNEAEKIYLKAIKDHRKIQAEYAANIKKLYGGTTDDTIHIKH